MRIAQVAPLFEAVPPKLYGGTERVVSNLTEELVALGHDVTLFASGDSVTAARLEPILPRAIRLDPAVKDWIAVYMCMLERVYRQAADFDVLHFHIDYFPFSLFKRQRTPFVTTLHGRLDLPEFAAGLQPVPGRARGLDLRQPAGAPASARLGRHRAARHSAKRCSRRSRPSRITWPSLAASRRKRASTRRSASPAAAGMKLKVAAKIDKADHAYYEEHIEPLLAAGARRVRRRDRRRAEARIPERRACLAVPDRLARALRPGDDRGHGVRHSGDRLQSRLGARGDRRRRFGLHRPERGGGGCRGPAPARARPGTASAASSSGASPRAGWRRTMSRSTRCSAPRRSCAP